MLNLSMLTDFYEFTMANGYFNNGYRKKEVVFDMFFRRIPDEGGYAIAVGLESVIDFIKNLKFTYDDIEYLRSKNLFSEDFLLYLENFQFSCDVYAIPEGTPVFPNEPLVIVKGPIIEAQLLESFLLLSVNHQSLIATKASRIVRAAAPRPVMEFGTRRAQGQNAAIYGARAAYIAGCSGTSCTICDQLFGIPVSGTMAHSWVQLFDTEYEAFSTYTKTYPDDCTLLVDTYNVLKSGIPNAIRVFDDVLKPLWYRPRGIRIDSGDITYLSNKARKMLNAAGYPDCKIVVSNSLDEYIIRDTLIEGADVDIYGVGERLITSKSEPVFGGVYKLVARIDGGMTVPKMKISENVQKLTTPGFKQVYRLFSNESGKAIADLVTLFSEKIDESAPLTIFDPEHTWKKQAVTNFNAKPLLVKIFDKGNCVYSPPSITEIRGYCAAQLDTFWDEVKRFDNPHTYYVDLSKELWDVRHKLLSECGGVYETRG